ncbi:MAG: hypothetical protein ACU0DI_15415 [Paracoccaceae bacterium]
MTTKKDLGDWILESLQELEGEANVADIARAIWERHEDELRRSGRLFFTWQYDMRWAGQNLQQAGKLTKLYRSWRLI